ncbi:hypothetical protein [Thermoanaerobacter sp. YS13]|uniref:hypothetical protein n=1 Tax=Thermoanaerobacter sp. YS13 TaxID=1511746 RepID=UPI0005B3DCC4|nr:hypothetical protein [Thermoanaerobacter sp. YS13]
MSIVGVGIFSECPPQLLTKSQNNKVFSVDYATSDNMKNIECIYVHEINNIDPNAMTVREYHEKMKKEKVTK